MAPLASLVIGAGPAVLLVLAAMGGFPPLFAALLAVAAAAIVGGAMSEDAVADAADGLFGGTTPERRLEILKDSRHGTYGVLAIVLVIGLKTIALASMAARDPIAAGCVWIGATVVARSGSLLLSFALPSARSNGLSASSGGVSRNSFIVGLVVATGLAVAIWVPFVGPLAMVPALVLAVLVAVGWIQLCRKLVGGQTGDLIGALQALLEITILATIMRMLTG